MKKTLIISKILINSWNNHFNKLTDGNLFVKLVFKIFILILVFSFYFMNKNFIYPFFLDISGDLQAFLFIFTVVLANISLIIAFILSFFIIISPGQTYLDNYLNLMPVKVNQKIIGYYIPLIAITFFTAILIYMPIVISIILAGSVSFFIGFFILIGILAHILIVILFNLNLYTIINICLERFFHLKIFYNKIFSSLVLMLSSLVAFILVAPSSQVETFNITINHSNALFLILQKPLIGEFGVINLVGIFSVFVLIIVLFKLLYYLSSFSLKHGKSSKFVLLRNLSFGDHPFVSFFVKELKLRIRHDENVIGSVFILISCFSITLINIFGEVNLESIYIIAPFVIWLMASQFAQNTYGSTKSTHWIQQITPVDRLEWLLAKTSANFCFSVFLAVLMFIILSVSSHLLTFISFFHNFYIGLLLTLLFMWIGIIFPFTEEYPYSSVISFILLMIISIPFLYFFQKIIVVIPEYLLKYIVLGVYILIFFLIYKTDQWRSFN
ncbi:MAG: hypothetical protein ACOC1K_03280 [Nanoarchaeota archaeon]